MKHRTIALLAAVALFTGACGGDDEATATTQPQIDPSRVSPEDLPEIPEVSGQQGAIRDLRVDECTIGEGEQSVTGSFQSTADAAADFVLSVSWTNATSDVMGRVVETYEGVEPGDVVEFDLSTDVAEGATQCVPGLVYGDAG